TKKEYEQVSESDEETVQSVEDNVSSTSALGYKGPRNSPKKVVTKSPKKANAVPSVKKKTSKEKSRAKQPSIMNFFNKK
ncbi:hypothetical protein SK128_004957, partial [Halocaridina rubra]